jgi:hypothetical protein
MPLSGPEDSTNTPRVGPRSAHSPLLPSSAAASVIALDRRLGDAGHEPGPIRCRGMGVCDKHHDAYEIATGRRENASLHDTPERRRRAAFLGQRHMLDSVAHCQRTPDAISSRRFPSADVAHRGPYARPPGQTDRARSAQPSGRHPPRRCRCSNRAPVRRVIRTSQIVHREPSWLVRGVRTPCCSAARARDALSDRTFLELQSTTSNLVERG